MNKVMSEAISKETPITRERASARRRTYVALVKSKTVDPKKFSVLQDTRDVNYVKDLLNKDLSNLSFSGLVRLNDLIDNINKGIVPNNEIQSLRSEIDSPSLEAESNKIIERATKGKIKAEEVITPFEARRRAKGLKRFGLVPSSNQDLAGLLWSLAGKGKQGDADLKFFKDKILDPINSASRLFQNYKQSTLNGFKQIRKKHNITNSRLTSDKKGVDGYSIDFAVRIYLFNKQGADTGLPQDTVDRLVDFVEKNYLEFANDIEALTGRDGGYIEYSNDFLGGTIGTDILSYINTDKRAEIFSEFSDNTDAIFSDSVLNKLRAALGNNYVDALENSIERTKTGKNRIFFKDKRLNDALEWLTGSVGVTMFLNTRSALTQLVSILNYFNFGFNNPFNAAIAFSNQKQLWTDFHKIFFSPWLKDRRGGLVEDITADELAKAASGKSGWRGAIAKLIQIGYTPTQIADSFAISFGGAMYYRNNINSLLKKNPEMTLPQAEERAFLNLQETSEQSQQSSRPDKVSQDQASNLGRVALAFANTPILYARLANRAALDLIRGRGDWKTNFVKMMWYGVMSHIAFTLIQQAFFGILGLTDDDDDPDKIEYASNSILDSIIRGWGGLRGASLVALKNTLIQWYKLERSKVDPTVKEPRVKDWLNAVSSYSAPVNIKTRQAITTYESLAYYDDDLTAATNAGAFIFNAPLNRVQQKYDNFAAIASDDYTTGQDFLLWLGYRTWQFGGKKSNLKFNPNWDEEFNLDDEVIDFDFEFSDYETEWDDIEDQLSDN